jgi:type I site-specific restriction endonuclease
MSGTPQLRPCQRDVIARVEAEIDGGLRRIVLVAPTGGGKTVIAGAIVADAMAHHCWARTYRRLLGTYPDAAVIARTITPSCGDGRGLGSTYKAPARRGPA